MLHMLSQFDDDISNHFKVIAFLMFSQTPGKIQ